MSSDIQRGEDGRIVAKELSSERARELQRLSIEAHKRNKDENQQAKAEKILAGLGLAWNEAPEDKRVLARMAAREDAGAVAAINNLQRQTGNIVKQEKAGASQYENWKAESGDPCPLCGGNRVTIALDDESALDLERILSAHN